MILILGHCSFFTLPSANAEENKRISIGTAGIAGVLYPFGVSLAQVITQNVPNLQVTGEATAGSIENIRNLTSGKTALAFSQNQNATQAFQGTGVYAQRPAPDLRSVAATIVSYFHIFVPLDSEIQSIHDMKGKRVSVGAAGSGGEVDVRTLLAFYNLDYNSIKPQFIPETEAISALKDGRIDAIICTHPLKSAAMTELTQSTEVRLIPIEDDAFYTHFPYFAKGLIPANTYPHNNTDIVSPLITNFLFTSIYSGLTDNDIYNITKAIWENRDKWKDVHPTVSEQVLLENALFGLTIPLAEGAKRYYQEKNILP